MEQSPVAGYLKAAMFGILAFVVFVSVWQKGKTEDKIVELDKTVAQMDKSMATLRTDLRDHDRKLREAVAVNQTLAKFVDRAMKRGVAVVPTRGTDAPEQPADDDDEPFDLGGDKPKDWGWHLNARYDRAPDPSRPLGTPGRYKNFLKLDPAGHQSQDNVPHREGVLNVAWGPEPKGFNVLIENYATLSDQVETYTQDTVANRHWKRPSAFSQGPGLCWRVEVSPDYKEYTLFFRRDAYWHEPQVDLRKHKHLAGKHAVTARDLQFTVQIIQDQQSNCASTRAYYDEMEPIEVIDDYTCVVRWKRKLFTSLSWTLNGYIIPRFLYAFDENGSEYSKDTVAQEFNDHWYDQLRLGQVGCGPYRFVKYESNKYVRIERWDDWWGFKEIPPFPLRAIHQKIYRESETAQNWGRTGELDLFGLSSTRFREWVKEEKDPQSPFKNGQITVYKAPATSYLYIGWKNSDPLFEDKRVRQALTYACNRKEICDKIFLGRYEPMSAPVYPASEEADNSLQPYPFDLRTARRLLDEAGWKINEDTGLREKVVKGRTIKFEFQLNFPGPAPDFENALNQFKNDLIQIGVKMEPLSSEWAQFQKDLHDRKFNAFSLLWVTPGWEHDFKQIWHSAGIQDPGSSNYIEFNNPEVDRLSDELRTNMDPKERVQIVKRIGNILYEEQPYTFFAWRKVFRAYHKHVKGVKENPYFTRPLLRFYPLWFDNN